ncbi:hypothetical protein NONO_c22020 [Nocardia nova SH22a]|uniref:Secreted protein n=1 Tax=Nocardia nova SH22a TaxID=1415166 RepID=W5TCC8_9NOCA|nr:hypothetical protein [Nocardia nova]AHH17000.1 hypothetical protein NONO_c22020 [Nocardia nova SH22a]
MRRSMAALLAAAAIAGFGLATAGQALAAPVPAQQQGPVDSNGCPPPPPNGPDGKPVPLPNGPDGRPLPPPTDNNGNPCLPPGGQLPLPPA